MSGVQMSHVMQASSLTFQPPPPRRLPSYPLSPPPISRPISLSPPIAFKTKNLSLEQDIEYLENAMETNELESRTPERDSKDTEMRFKDKETNFRPTSVRDRADKETHEFESRTSIVAHELDSRTLVIAHQLCDLDHEKQREDDGGEAEATGIVVT